MLPYSSPLLPEQALAPVDPSVYDTAARLSMADTGKMAFVGLKQPDERADVIAYLKKFSSQ